MNRTSTIKRRTVYLYLPSEKMVKRWKDTAAKAGTSLSKFVTEHVENEINSSEDFISRVDLVNRIERLEEENNRLRKEKSHLDIVVDKLQQDLQEYRLQPFVSSQFEGVRQFEQCLIETFKSKGSIRSDDLWREIGISPNDTNFVKAISRQLTILEQYGLIKKTHEGWQWKG